MTAEVGVMNRLGVALAADSAVTVGPAAGKIYSSADKLFQLSEKAPVGIMIYGSASFLGIPWETIIKTYRARHQNKLFPLLKDYADDFICYLKTEKRMFSAAVQKNFVESIANTFLSYFRGQFQEALQKELDTKKPLTETKIKRIFTDLVRDELNRTKGFPKFDALPRDFVKSVRNKYRNIIATARRQIFEGLPVSRLTAQRLAELISELLTCRRLEVGGSPSGIVIAGFGENEHFPALVEILLAGIVAGYPLQSRMDYATIGKGIDAYVAPFAQTEMVYTFMQGIDPDLQSMIQDSTTLLFQKVASTILDQVKSKDLYYGTNLEKSVDQNLAKLLKDLQEYWNKIRRRDYSDPVMEMVASLPKDELGAMAESLVNLTKFKRRVSKQHETVGGPIDVAIITKGDGFVWVKRKHYFEPDLNPRYIARVYRGDAR